MVRPRRQLSRQRRIVDPHLEIGGRSRGASASQSKSATCPTGSAISRRCRRFSPLRPQGRDRLARCRPSIENLGRLCGAIEAHLVSHGTIELLKRIGKGASAKRFEKRRELTTNYEDAQPHQQHDEEDGDNGDKHISNDQPAAKAPQQPSQSRPRWSNPQTAATSPNRIQSTNGTPPKAAPHLSRTAP